MPFYIYILQSDVDGSFYKGYSTNPILRLQRHNNGETNSTRKLVPWKLVYVEEWENKREALIREKNLKKADRLRITALITSPKNVVTDFVNPNNIG